ncbi:MAG TPA: hypothetical protein EYP10_04785 [Armatimonadetes bacterium]|nr:hypothetical protein [Armatimonadota bacterium]
MRTSKRQQYRSFIEFFAGIMVVLGIFGIYYVSKNYIGPYLRKYAKGSEPSTAPASTKPERRATTIAVRPGTTPFIRSDMAYIPEETTVTVEPIPTTPLERAPTGAPEESGEPSENVMAPAPPTEPTRRDVPEIPQQPSEQASASEQRSSITASPPADTTVQEKPEASTESSEEPKPEEASTKLREKRYRVQVGIFKLKENSEALVQELVQKGYQPFVEEDKSEDGEIVYRVFVGAFDDRESADKLRRELQQQNIAAIVREVQ